VACGPAQWRATVVDAENMGEFSFSDKRIRPKGKFGKDSKSFSKNYQKGLRGGSRKEKKRVVKMKKRRLLNSKLGRGGKALEAATVKRGPSTKRGLY